MLDMDSPYHQMGSWVVTPENHTLPTHKVHISPPPSSTSSLSENITYSIFTQM